MLLDTCALLWLVHDPERLSPPLRRRLEQLSTVHVSAITAFEIGLKHAAGKLVLPLRPAEWFRAVIEHHGLSVIDLDAEICSRATELPAIHRDPCDRFIVATALARHLPVVSADDRFRRYGVEVLL